MSIPGPRRPAPMPSGFLTIVACAMIGFIVGILVTLITMRVWGIVDWRGTIVSVLCVYGGAAASIPVFSYRLKRWEERQ